MAESKSIRYVKGVGEKKAESFKKLGVETVQDFVSLYPRRYEDVGNVVDVAHISWHRGEKVSVIAKVTRPLKETRVKGGMLLTTVFAEDLSGMLRIVYFNNKYIKNTLHEDGTYLFYGKVTGSGELVNPEVYSPSVKYDGGLLPVYPLVSGLSQKFMRKIADEALAQADYQEVLPSDIRFKYSLIEYRDAIYGVHKPVTWEQINFARKRLVFEELLYYSLGLRMLRHREKAAASVTIKEVPTGFLELHPFSPTSAQSSALCDIYGDLASGFAMNRLLQGDVGSGKTLVAGQAAYAVISAGAQVAVMVPTEVLANQHYRYFEEKFSKLGINIALLTSSCTAKAKREIKAKIKSGEVRLVVGTHAVIQKDVEFENLGLVVTDEQHRFGVMQRAELTGKGEGAHVLVMSATPIPRTLALMLWGDLDLSVIDVMPQGRQKVSTYLVDSGFEERLHAFIQKNIDAGGRVYVVCPMIEEGEDGSELASAKERFEGLCKLFGKENCGLVHGKLSAADKDRAMRDFAEGRTKILVSTTVIEVGVNVPEATLMIIENAERFGLSQLHQLRGRVGRGEKKSYCVLVSDKMHERLEFFTKTTDGFEIANKDLQLRGPGNFFGKDQSGLSGMQVADMAQDMDEVKNASECANFMLERSADLSAYPGVKKNVLRLFDIKGEIFN
ncbi:MAG: ATP-dependent DNA helicase RecG [Clostridia bacterium]|nr:ATP-dependent DNA helicase RecG [Clostridia bacterium]